MSEKQEVKQEIWSFTKKVRRGYPLGHIIGRSYRPT